MVWLMRVHRFDVRIDDGLRPVSVATVTNATDGLPAFGDPGVHLVA